MQTPRLQTRHISRLHRTVAELWTEYTEKSFDSLICEAVEKDICVRQLPIAMQKKENVEWTGGT